MGGRYDEEWLEEWKDEWMNGWKHGVCLDASMDGRGKDGMINAIKDA